MKILIVDDDDIALAIARKVLEQDGHSVILAGNGKEAQEIIRQEPVEAVILDWNMPLMNGIELTRYIRSNGGLQYTYILMITARNKKEDLLQGLSAGANDFITKPFEPAELLLRVRNAEKILNFQTTTLTLFSLAKLAESKDSDTGFHLERIRAYAQSLATQLIQLSAPEDGIHPHLPDLLYHASPLHDIGKVGIPDTILLKPGHLTETEWTVMKGHVEIGARTIEEVLMKFPQAEYLHITRDIILCHHERWDGSGYPRGLKGEEIPLAARIVALADVYDALTMKRVYKNAIPHDIARGIILDSRGKHFDPDIVDAFLAAEQEFIRIHDSYPESP